MGRPRNFDRKDVLTKTLPLFWARGFADTGLQDIEKATGVNKSSLYSEFKNKEDLFVATLRHYGETFEANELLKTQPLGWDNIQKFLERIATCPGGNRGCFAVNSMREIAILPTEAKKVLIAGRNDLERLLIENIAAEETKTSPEALASLLSTFFSGFCMDLHFNANKGRSARKAKDFIKMLRTM